MPDSLDPGVRAGTVGRVPDLSVVPNALFAVYAGVFGAVIASFLCVVAERVPRGESIGGRSHCVCGRQLRGTENVPVVGWVLARGKARCCGAQIPARYVLAEVGLAAAWAAGVAAFGLSWAAVAVAAVSAAALVATCWRR